MTLLLFQDTSTKITVSSISDVSSFNPERVISIRGTIPSISKAEAEVNILTNTFLYNSYRQDFQESGTCTERPIWYMYTEGPIAPRPIPEFTFS